MQATLFYGENGRGKSTLSAVLDSCGRNDPALIQSRATIGGDAPNPRAELVFDGGPNPVNFDGAWANHRPEISVFDSNFVHANAYTGLNVSSDNRRGLYEFALGDAINDIAELERLDEQAREANQEKALHTAHLLANATPYTLDQFIELVPDPHIEDRLRAARQLVTANADAARVQARRLLVPLNLRDLDLGQMFAVLSRTVADMNQAVVRRVVDHIDNHPQEGFEQWLAEGQTFDQDDECPYCGQGTLEIELVGALRKYFGAEYSTLHSDLSDMAAIALNYVGVTVMTAIGNTIVANGDLQDTWSDIHATERLPLDIDATLHETAELNALIERLHAAKAERVLSAVGSPEEVDEARRLQAAILGRLRVYNEAVAAINTAYEQRRAAIVAGNPAALRAEVARLEALARRGTNHVIERIAQFRGAATTATQAIAAKGALRERHDAYMEDLLRRYQDQINAHLTNFGAGFRIQDLEGVHAGGRTPRAQYLIDIRGAGIELEAQDGEPSFQTALSDGDRRTLALAFFLARLDLDPHLAHKIVVFDDPIASFDVYRKRHTIRAIEDLARRCAQVIVLSHDPLFLREVEQAMVAAGVPRVAHKIGYAAQDYAQFEDVNLAEVCKQPYFQKYFLITRFLNGEEPDRDNEVAKALRVLVEEFYKIRFPGNFGPTFRLGLMIEAIDAAPADSPIAALKPKLDDLNRFNDFASQYHHADPQVAAPLPNIQVLRAYARAALSLVHDDGQYAVPQ